MVRRSTNSPKTSPKRQRVRSCGVKCRYSLVLRACSASAVVTRRDDLLLLSGLLRRLIARGQFQAEELSELVGHVETQGRFAA